MECETRVLGIEGGGTKTEWILVGGQAENRGVLSSGSLPSANLKLITDTALAHLLEVLPRDPTHVGVFLAGCVTEEDRRRLRAISTRVWPHARISIGSDRDSAMATAFHGGDGIAVIAGTGAAVQGRRHGRFEKAGGWGQLLGDRGGGYDLAMQCLRYVLTQYDLHHQITPMATEILRMLGINRLEQLVDWVMKADKMSVARLAPCVFGGARSSEPEMFAILERGAQVLAEFTRAVAGRLGWEDPPVRLLGGIFAHHEDYVSLFTYRLSLLLPKATVSLCRRSGAEGAAWLAGRVDHAANTAAAGDFDSLELEQALTERPNERSANLSELGTADLVELFVTEEQCVTDALEEERERLIIAVDLVSRAVQNGGRLFYVGAGTSGRLGVLDASEIPPTFGASPELVQGIIAGGATALHRAVEGAEDQPEAGAHAVFERGVRPGDAVCGITASGRTPFVLGALRKARELGASTLLLSCNPARNPSATPFDVEIDLPTGPELITGSTRLKAGTATKIALNILSTCAMVRLGKVQGNAMVDVQISNEKLKDRGIRLIGSQLGIPYDEAHKRLEEAGWSVREALKRSYANPA